MRQRGPGIPAHNNHHREYQKTGANKRRTTTTTTSSHHHHHPSAHHPPETASSWEITSEKNTILTSEPPRSHDHKLSSYPQHIHYQTTGTFLSADLLQTAGEHQLSLFEMPRLDEFHIKYRTAHHVPDRSYQEYLFTAAASGSSNGIIVSKRRPRPWITRPCCASGCAGFSLVAMFFLIGIGIMLDRQPLYIKGSLPASQIYKVQQSGRTRVSVQYLLPLRGERLPSARSAYRAAWAYGAIFLVSLFALYPGWFQAQLYRRFQKYQNIPDSTSSSSSVIPTFHNEYYDEEEARVLSRPSSYYQPGLWNRTTGWLKQWLAQRGWFIHPKFRRKHNPKTI